MSNSRQKKIWLSTLRDGELFRFANHSSMIWYRYGGYETTTHDIKKQTVRFGFFWYFDLKDNKSFTIEDREVIRPEQNFW